MILMKGAKMSTKNDRIRLVAVGIIAVIVVSGGSAKADFTFGEPVNLGPVINSPLREGAGQGFSDDGLSLAFVRQPSGANYVEGWLGLRPTLDSPWEAQYIEIVYDLENAFKMPDVQACFTELMTPDGLEAYFGSTRVGGHGGSDIWKMTRETTDGDWSMPENLGPTVNSPRDEWQIVLSPDGLELYFCDDADTPRSGGYGSVDIWVTRRETIGTQWSQPVNLGSNVNSDGWDSGPYLSHDGLLLLFESRRSGGYGSWDFYLSQRASLSDPWEKAVNLGPIINSPEYEEGPQLSPDGSTLYWSSKRPGGYGNVDIWQASVEPVVDLNADGIVDAADMCIIVDHWGTDYSLCDIGPTPFGDGVVDVQDLIVLAKHLFEESGLIAYWMLDETEGDIAYDSVGGYNGILVGDPTWQTDAGMIAGALEFDGIDDHIVTDCVIDPADGTFSIFAWIQGGAQGEVILSQVCPMNWDVEWLLADPVAGALATDQKLTLLHKTLTSNVVITDGGWHHVGISWNGSERKLYVDNIEVARDSQTTLAPGGDGLQIGTGSKRTSNSFWSGLIDDIRIYNVALTADEIAAMAQ
jgi:hypothetical protein